MRIKVISDGVITKVVDADTGEVVKFVTEIALHQKVGGHMTATLKMANVPVEIVAEVQKENAHENLQGLPEETE
jgi:hypothetical protein